MEPNDPLGSLSQAPPGTLGTAGVAELINAVHGAAESPAGADADSQTFARMCFRVGHLGLLAPPNDGREVITPPPVSRVPNTASWMRGLANIRGELVPVVDAAAALGVTRQTGARTYLLIFGQGENTIGLLIDGLPRLLHLSATGQLPEPPGMPRLLADSVMAAYEHTDRVWLDVDLDVLFDTLARHIALA